MNQIGLNGHVAVLTGCAQRIGFAIAKRLVASGANVLQNFPHWPSFLTTLSAPLLVFILFQKYFAMGVSNTSGGKE
nr:hypothetical protein [uncultured Devosia sp.]